jgi:hypothetical protein
MTTNRSVCHRDRPRDRAAADWLGGPSRCPIGRPRDIGRVDQGQRDNRIEERLDRDADDPETGDAEAEDVDHEHARQSPEDVDVDRRQEAKREEDRSGQAAQNRDQEAQQEDQDLGDEEELHVHPERPDDRRERPGEDLPLKNEAWTLAQPGR